MLHAHREDACCGGSIRRVKEGETAADVARRNQEILAASARGIGPAAIARTYQLDEDHVAKIIREHKDSRPPLDFDTDPAEIVRGELDALDAAIEELALAAVNADNSNAKVGAIGKRLDALRQKRDLLQSVGLLPLDLGTLHVSVDLQAMAIRVVDEVFEKHNLPPEVQADIIDAIDPPNRGGLPEIAGTATEK